MLKHIKSCFTKPLLIQKSTYSYSSSHPNSEKIQLPTLKFDKTSSQWIPTNPKPEHTKLNDISQLTFLTHNIWFERHNYDERGIELRKIMENSNADFVCLQEVKRRFYRELLSSPWAQNYYISGNPVIGYKTLILSKHPCRFFTQQFPSNMERSLIYSEFELNNTLTAVGTVHLESLNFPGFRKAQLDISFQEFEDYKIAFLMGDFNMDNEKENKNIREDYVDIWKALHPTDPGHTMLATRIYSAWRPDRVIMKKNDLSKPVSIERIGMEPLEKYKDRSSKVDADEITTPSDHYGLKCVVEIRT